MRKEVTRAALFAAALAAIGTPAPAQETGGSCVTCHEALGGALAAPVQAYADGVHAGAGFGCAACHGGDPTVEGLDAMDPAKGYLGVPGATEIAQVCGRCHSSASFMRQYDPGLRVDQVAEYRTSVHGQRLFGAGDTAVAVCSSCHGAHGIRPASDPRSFVHPLRVAGTCGSCHADPDHMEPYPIPTDQEEEYERSIHWERLSEAGDLSAPTCNDCHGNHGAAPPGISWVGNVCGQCHVVMADYFDASPHSEVFEMLGAPGCAYCHDNHEVVAASDRMLGLGEGAVCADCHVADDAGGESAARMRGLIESLQSGLDSARSVLLEAEDAGVEVGDALVSLNDGQSALVKARAAVHAFDVDSVMAKVEPGDTIAAAALARGMEALDELRIRRIGLAVSVLIILALIVGLALKIRLMESGTRASVGAATIQE